MSELHARGLSGLPEIVAGADLAELIARAARGEPEDGSARSDAGRREPHDSHESLRDGGEGLGDSGEGLGDGGEGLRDGEIVVVAHKAVSKAEGAVVELADVQPSERARELAAGDAALSDGQPRDPRVVQVILDQSRELVRARRGVLICRTYHGFVCANAGVDASNAPAGVGEESATLIVLPADPDASARRLRARLHELTGVRVAVLITDSFGRAWRQGQCDVALGCAGMAPLDDWRGRRDGVGRELAATVLAVADAAAATADLARAKDSREPVVVIDGLQRFVAAEDGPGATALLRPLEEDLFQ